MPVAKRNEKLKIAHLKILAATQECSEAGILPNADGILAVLRGSVGDEPYSRFLTFGTLTSIHDRPGKRMIGFLLEKGYLDRRYKTEHDAYYFLLTEEGEFLARRYLSKPRKQARGKRKVEAPLFINKE